VEILYTFPTCPCVKMCHTVPRPMPRVWHIARLHWSWYRMTHINTWPSWKLIQNLHKFRNYKSIRQHSCFCVDRKCKITYFSRSVQPSNMLCGTTTSAVHLAMCHAVPWPVQPSNTCHTATNNPFRINVSIVFLSVVFYNDFVQFCVDR
jgi:hypothetical protein